MEMTNLIDSNSRFFLERSLRNGSAILFTGAGFSSLAVNSVRQLLPSGTELRDALWQVAFPSDPLDRTSNLGEVFDAALRLSRRATESLLRDRLTVDVASLPELYRSYFSAPWWRIYTVNIDDLIPAAQRHFSLANEIRVVSALTQAVPPPDILSAIYLNGILGDFPKITFSPLQYGDRAARPDDAYSTLLRDMRSHCVVFVGTQLDEPPLWQHIALRGDPPAGRELRPKSFLVVPSIGRARAALLDRLNIHHIPLNVKEFAEQFVGPATSEQPVRPSYTLSDSLPFERMAHALSEPVVDGADFLLGREPTWADVTHGFAVVRAFEDDLLKAANDPSVRVIALYATSGAGKSTTLRRLALTLHSAGKRVGWLRSDTSQSLHQIKAAALARGFEYVVIDRAERFGERGVDFVRGLAEAEQCPQVVVSYGATAFDELSVQKSLEGINLRSEMVPLLCDQDIALLIDALTRGHRLGRLAGRTPEQQMNAFKQRAGRQLLVAMIEATSGQKFEEKIINECRTLSPDLVPAYAIVALATSLRYGLRTDDLLAALSEVTNSGLELIDRLQRHHLILRTPGSAIVARHPVIAREAVTYYRRSGQLMLAIDRLAFVMASKIYAQMARSAPERRLLNSLVSHQYLGETIESVSQVRDIYNDLESLLYNDAHFWLQRGSYELERGEIDRAENFLAQARNLSGDDYMIETEWAYLLMKRACLAPADSRAREWMSTALTSLFDIITQRGSRSVKTYVVLAQQVICWASVASLSTDEKKALFLGVRSVMAEGDRYHNLNRQFVAARTDIERAYLGLATSA
jgi:hypothetical protein